MRFAYQHEQRRYENVESYSEKDVLRRFYLMLKSRYVILWLSLNSNLISRLLVVSLYSPMMRHMHHTAMAMLARLVLVRH